MAVRAAQFLAIVCSALALIPSGAHLAALPNKVALPQAEFFIVQDIYRGWAILGMLWLAALAANAALAFLVRADRAPFRYAVLAAMCWVLVFTVFLGWTFPANQATANWTAVPENWDALRRQWEYSHAANTAIAVAALCLTSLSVLSWRPNGR